jgi:predicted dehydrogenase/threonine dehydrogenase-like Zn-dependent dehydrogenase
MTESTSPPVMRQVLQSLSNGRTELAQVPAPAVTRGGLAIRTTRSLISAGTERMLVDFGRASLIDKARQQPEKVRQVLSKIGTDGLFQTIDAVRSKLDQPLPLGYCNVGVVTDVGVSVRGFASGERVVSNGPHAEYVVVPRNLCARVPENVSDDEATFTVLGSIALQGVRLAQPTLGERFVVIGLGLIGLITVQLLRANGCRVLGIDPDPVKSALARTFGADVVALDRGEDVVAASESFSSGVGVDGVLITAATQSDQPVNQAARICRTRGRIILVGVAGLQLDRSEFFKKEISFQVSCSYGPGRYDPQYEEQGHDYPVGFVRWTEQRNFEAVLDLLASGKLDVRTLITHRFAFGEAPRAYELLANRAESYLGILLLYPNEAGSSAPTRTVSLPTQSQPLAGAVRLGVIGAGNYAGRVLIPAFAGSGAQLQAIASGGGVSAAHFGRKYGFTRATTDSGALIAATDIDAVVIATRHDSHARYVQQALAAGKHVFVEKPLSIDMEEVETIATQIAGTAASPLLTVGFNRRFAPHIVRMKELLAGVRGPKSYVITVNAGAIPAAHWTQDPQIGGGRIVGECCHFIDLLRFLADAPIASARIVALGGGTGAVRDDTVSLTLTFEDGSWGTVHYLANGHRDMPKERVEAFCGGRVLQLDNFRSLRGFGWPGFKKMNLWRQDKGQAACARAFIDAVKRGGPAPIPLAEVLEVARVSLRLGEAARA